MRRCDICGTPYLRGSMVDVGVGFMQVSEDEPACDCEYKAWQREENRYKYCNLCGKRYDSEESDADSYNRYCSVPCEEEDNGDC